MNKIKILEIVPSLSQANGVAACICNYFDNMNPKKFDVTFAVLNDRPKDRYDNVKKNGGKVIELFREKNIFKYISNVKKFLKNNEYDIIHCNVANTGLIFLYYAKKYGIKTRILHSHATKSADKLINKIRNDIILFFTKRFANNYFACSNAAGKSMFKNKKFFVINNCIDYDTFKYDEISRIKIRKKLDIEDSIILGNIGRLCNQKNQIFILELIKKINDSKYKAIIIGNGILEEELKIKAKELKIEKQVLFTGSITNTNEFYSVFDIFVLPSLYEGLPVVGVEAQANGVPCLFSTNITKEVKINDNVKFIDLKLDDWIESLKNVKRVDKNNFLNSDFCLKNETKKLEKVFMDMCGDKNDV